MRNNRRYKRPVVNIINKEKATTKDFLSLKDILIPLLTASLALLGNQIFFEQNKKTEAIIETDKETFKDQFPVLNKILAFTYKSEISTVEYSIMPIQKTIYMDSKGNVVKEESKEMVSSDSVVNISMPSFAFDSIKRNRFFKDLESIRKESEYLDHHIYIKLDNVYTYLESHQLPNLSNNKELINSEWSKVETMEQWETLILELRTVCLEKMNNYYSM